MHIEKYRIDEQNNALLDGHERRFAFLSEEIHDVERIIRKLVDFQVAIPSWALGTGGTRFGRFSGGGEPRNLEEKIEDIGLLHALNRSSGAISLHIPWDIPKDAGHIKALAEQHGLAFDAMNSNTFQDQPNQQYTYKYGSLQNVNKATRQQAIDHNIEVIKYGVELGSQSLTVWLSDGSCFPGQLNFRQAFQNTLEGLQEIYTALPADWKMFVEYKAFEPNFYSTTVGDWGQSLLYASKLGPKAYTLVDLGHHLPNANIEQIVSLLLMEGKLGGFHFNDSKYGDDDLTVGSIKPYQLFLIFNELVEGMDARGMNHAEGTGGKIYFPAKDHPSDEPDKGVDLKITVPKGLVVAGPGLLQGVTTKKGQSTYHWKTNYTISNYSILFNVGDYTVVKRTYTSINGTKIPVEFYVLRLDSAKAGHLLDLLEIEARVKEKYFGEYPWAREKMGIVETPHLGMEHQTMIAYGNKFKYTNIGGQDFDWLLNHEFGHEWWGNKVTAKDWADYWVHEGIGSFGDALYTYEKEGEEAYERIYQKSIVNIKNDKPIVLGKDIAEEEAYHPDIYSKGSFFMHTLRYVMGDAVFFSTLKQLATDSMYTYNHLVTTDDVLKLFSGGYGKDLSPLFHLYLYTTDKLGINVKQTAYNTYTIKLDNIDMPLPLDITTSEGTTKQMVDNKKGVVVKSTTLPLIDTHTFYIKKITYE